MDNEGFDTLIGRYRQGDSPNLYDDVIGEVEQRLVEHVLQATEGDKVEAARRLGINPALLRSRAALKLLDLETLHDNGHATPLIRPNMTLAEIESEAIRRAIDQTNGCRKQAAKLLGVSTRTMQRRVKELGI
ncbi:helix-turn-helix domain-containing protein [Planctomycetes bacterium TBK1r]|uniref:Global DNA-binding transcriptional dual regulator Fis n=1 Tax=Stieleria magnilauensis TaxID=2527963 RepID=A0ABX5XL61_9BACT|nr:global DNA-binding transcriptional dual regulator Fis [Planctomycetes bacterium TBK1r]